MKQDVKKVFEMEELVEVKTDVSAANVTAKLVNEKEANASASTVCERVKLTAHSDDMQSQVNSRFGATCLFITGFMAFFTNGYLLSYLSPVIPVLHHMYNKTYMDRFGESIPDDTWTLYLTLTISFLIIGGLVGGVSSKYWLVCLSRKHLLQLCHVINIISVIMMALVGALTWSPEVMIIGRFLSGFPLGIYYSLIPLMIAEMSARSKQALWQSCAAIGVTTGALIGAVLAHPKVLGTLQYWPALVSTLAVPSVLYVAASAMIPETPYYLAKHGHREKALQALIKLRDGDQELCENELNSMLNEMRTGKVVGIKEMVTTKQYRNQLIAICSLYANLMLVGFNNVILYADYVIRAAGVSEEASGVATIGIFGLQFVASLLGSFFINRFGGLKVLVGANFVIILSHGLYTVCQATIDLAPTIMPLLSVVAIAIFMVGWAGGTNLATFVMLGVLTIEPTRPTAFAYGGAVLWITAWLVGFVPPYLQNVLGPYAFTIWLGCAILFLIYQVIFLPDPKGRTSDEIQARFK